MAVTQAPGPARADVLSEDQFLALMTSCVVLWAAMVSLGLVSNVINVWAFVRLGLRDCISCCLFLLSVSDLGMVLAAGAYTVSSTMEILERSETAAFPLQPRVISLTSSFAREQFLLVSSLTTTFLALTRCACVAMPLKFRHRFTRRLAVRVLVVFVVFSFLNQAPLVAGLRLKTKAVANGTAARAVLDLGPRFFELSEVAEAAIDISANLGTQILSLVSLVVICVTLKRSARFRQQFAIHADRAIAPQCTRRTWASPTPSTSGMDITGKSSSTDLTSSSSATISSLPPEPQLGTSSVVQPSFLALGLPNLDPAAARTDSLNDLSPSPGIQMAHVTSPAPRFTRTDVEPRGGAVSRRELLAVKQVVVLTAVYVLTNTPRLVMVLGRMLEPGYYAQQKYDQAFRISNYIRVSAELLSACANIFIYASYNSRYRQRLSQAADNSCPCSRRGTLSFQ